MIKRIDPKKFDLPARSVLEQVDTDTVAIVLMRKSRVIMADGRKIVEKAEKIQKVLPEALVVLKTSAPVCSKTLEFLKEKGIRVLAA